MKVTLLSHTPEPEKIIAAAAKLCYSSKADIGSLMESLDNEEEVRAFIRKLMENHHESPLEHATFTFGIEGVSRSFLSQITRHRLASFSVRSQRYCSEDGAGFVMPSAIAANPDEKGEFMNAMEAAWGSYNQMLSLGTKKEDARAILPNACETRMIVTMNARELLHFFTLRCCSRAQTEIRKVASEMLKLCQEVAPSVFWKAGAACEYFGYCTEGKMSCGRKPTIESLLEHYANRSLDSAIVTGIATAEDAVKGGASAGREETPFEIVSAKKEARKKKEKEEKGKK